VTLNDRISKFKLVSGNVILSPTFEGIGTIQNLQLDGATLTGANVVTGTLGINGGGLGSASPLDRRRRWRVEFQRRGRSTYIRR